MYIYLSDCFIYCLQVILYRLGLITAAASFVISSSAAFIPEGNILGDIIKQDVDFLFIIGAGGLGLSLLLIHIYVTPIKRFLQSLWVLGVIGSVGTYIMFAKPLNQSLIEYVISNPVGVWFIGPLFAALTGVVFKEGISNIFQCNFIQKFCISFQTCIINLHCVNTLNIK